MSVVCGVLRVGVCSVFVGCRCVMLAVCCFCYFDVYCSMFALFCSVSVVCCMSSVCCCLLLAVVVSGGVGCLMLVVVCCLLCVGVGCLL